MKNIYISLVIVLVLFVSCGDTQNNTELLQEQEVQTDETYGNPDFKFPKVSTSAESFLNDWTVFDDFKTEAIAINGSNLSTLKNRSEYLVSRVDSLIKKIPDTLDTQSVYSRLLVAKTRAALLKQLANKVTIDNAEIDKGVYEMNLATTNLIVQINEKFQKDAIDSERTENEKKEMELRKKKMDSILRVEKQDLLKKQ
ncbi:hypothetical protein [Patiriisocius marinus]|uniref:Lipoprotein n=1 Tax=Patiriisocius marinus TaxID=1397112 RepID=A0A5J4IY87_9FLAO|nr:hypothetical protein [Patiriisocius marinus]GER58800.1 hypothetical protein ULMA_09080 [Patiriisocius marinus]